MKKIFLFVLAALFAAELSAQQLKVVHFEKRGLDLTAKLKPRTDNNGDVCALLRVQIAAPNCQFSDSYIVGETEQGFGEYLIYMAKGARRIRVVHPDFLFVPLDYEFPEPLQSMDSYALVLEVPIYTHYAEIVEQQTQKPAAQPATQPTQKATKQEKQSKKEKQPKQEKQSKQAKSEKPTTSVATAPLPKPESYKVGDYYNENGKEGVVFWVDATGKHGKVISLTESASELQWSSDKKEQKRLIGADNEADGAKNMAVVKQILDWQSKYPAFKWCADLGDGWYLPAVEELQIFTLNDVVHHAVNRTLKEKGGKKLANKGEWKWYWSSTESSKKFGLYFCAWSVSMDYGDTYRSGKDYDYYVRAVSAF